MAFNLSSFTEVLMRWVGKGTFWVIVFAVIFLLGFGGLWIRKQRKLEYPCMLVTSLGNGKISTRKIRCGWFKSHETFFGLWDYGNETVLKLSDGRRVLAASLEDMQEIDGKMGFIVYRKDDDAKIVVPINKARLKGRRMVWKIAPADYRDAATEVVNSAVKETQSAMERFAPAIIFGVLIVFSLIIILLIVQFANNRLDAAQELVKEMSANAKTVVIYSQNMSTAP